MNINKISVKWRNLNLLVDPMEPRDSGKLIEKSASKLVNQVSMNILISKLQLNGRNNCVKTWWVQIPLFLIINFFFRWPCNVPDNHELWGFIYRCNDDEKFTFYLVSRYFP